MPDSSSSPANDVTVTSLGPRESCGLGVRDAGLPQPPEKSVSFGFCCVWRGPRPDHLFNCLDLGPATVKICSLQLPMAQDVLDQLQAADLDMMLPICCLVGVPGQATSSIAWT